MAYNSIIEDNLKYSEKIKNTKNNTNQDEINIPEIEKNDNFLIK
ncbi:MAG: hypothetical protein U0T83_07755 [Bacteriovoracaceae bacterium]